jgi:hypothetical protein
MCVCVREGGCTCTRMYVDVHAHPWTDVCIYFGLAGRGADQAAAVATSTPGRPRAVRPHHTACACLFVL